MKFYEYITDFIFVDQEPEPADVIFLPGGNYPEAAIHAAELYHDGWAPVIIPSGRYSTVKGYFEPEDPSGFQNEKVKLVYKDRYETECDYLSDILTQLNVPEQAVLGEDQATYTYENAIYSRKLVEQKGIQVKRAILSCQAFHARRCLLYYQEQFPDVEFLVCPIETKGIGKENWHRTEKGIDTVLGEMERCGGQFHQIMRNLL